MITESTIALAAAEYLKREGWEAYYEVVVRQDLRCETPTAIGRARVDAAFTRGSSLAAMQAKLQFSFHLFEQCRQWVPYANIVWMVAPAAERRASNEAIVIAEERGYGVMEYGDRGDVHIVVTPVHRRRQSEALQLSLCEEHVGGRRPCAVFLDPPYGHEVRDPYLYAEDVRGVAARVAEWAREHGDDPDLRIALCGYEGEHEMPSTWTKYVWKAARGYAAKNNENRALERI